MADFEANGDLVSNFPLLNIYSYFCTLAVNTYGCMKKRIGKRS
jgi:hypothetical protein